MHCISIRSSLNAHPANLWPRILLVFPLTWIMLWQLQIVQGVSVSMSILRTQSGTSIGQWTATKKLKQEDENYPRVSLSSRSFFLLNLVLVEFDWLLSIRRSLEFAGGGNVIANVDLVIGLGIGKPSNWSLQTINGLWFKVEKRKSKNSLVTPSYTTRANLEISFITKDKFCLSFDVLFIFADCFCQYIRFWLRGH